MCIYTCMNIFTVLCPRSRLYHHSRKLRLWAGSQCNK